MTKVRTRRNVARACVPITRQKPLQFQDEGVNLGGTDATEVDFVGDSVTATRTGSRIVVTHSASGGGGSALTNHPIASGVPAGASAGERFYLTGTAGTILGEAVAEGTVMEARIANAVNRADWYFNQGGS